MELADYTAMVTKFFKKLEKQIKEDFPNDVDLLRGCTNSAIQTQMSICQAFLKKQ